jgi:hypothetical protein
MWLSRTLPMMQKGEIALSQLFGWTGMPTSTMMRRSLDTEVFATSHEAGRTYDL